MLNENIISMVILSVITIGLIVYYTMKKLKVSDSTLTVFKGEELISYFKESSKILIEKKWLILLPLVLFILQYILNTVSFIYFIVSRLGFRSLFVHEAVNQYEVTIWIFQIQNLSAYFNNFITALVNLSVINYGRLINNSFFLIVSLISVISYKILINKLKSNLKDKENNKLIFLEYTLKFSLLIGIVVLILSYFIADLEGVLMAFNILLYISAIILFSFLQSIILLSIKEFFTRENYSMEYKLEQALDKFKYLLILNFFISLLFNLESIIIAFTLLTQIGISFSWLNYINSLIKIIVVIMTIFVSQFIVLNNSKLKEALRANIHFIKNNFLKFSILFLILIIIQFLIISLLRSINLVAFGLIYNHLVIGITGFVNVLFTVFFSVVLTKFFIDYDTNR